MADNTELKTRLQLLNEIEDKNNRIEAAIKNSALNQDLLNRYTDLQKSKNKELISQLKIVNKTRLEGLSQAESSLSSIGSMYDNITNLDKDRILAISKSDMLDDELKEEIAKDSPKDIPSLFISSVAQQGLTELKDIIWKKLNQ